GATYAETWTAHDGTVFVAVGAVFAGSDRIAVADLLRTAGRAVIGSMAMMANALRALDRIVRKHAQEQRDDELAAGSRRSPPTPPARRRAAPARRRAG